MNKTLHFDPVREARKLGAKLHRYEISGKWCVLDARPDSDLWTLSFVTIQNASKAFLIVYRKKVENNR